MTRDEVIEREYWLQQVADFDHPFRVNADGTITDRGLGVYAPEVFHVDGPGDVEIMSAGWVALTGYTGQHGYNGAVMHASEYLGGGLARDILATPGVYVVTAVEVLECDETCDPAGDDCPGDHEPAGWAVLRHV